MMASQQDDADAEEFQLPLLGLYADLESGHGSVSLPDEFAQAPKTVQIALIDDWLQGLARLRLRVLERADDQAPV